MCELVMGSLCLLYHYLVHDCCFAGNSRGRADSWKFYDGLFWGYRVDVNPFVILYPWPSAWQSVLLQATDVQAPCLFYLKGFTNRCQRLLFFAGENMSKAGKMISWESKELVKVTTASRWQHHFMLLWFLLYLLPL